MKRKIERERNREYWKEHRARERNREYGKEHRTREKQRILEGT
jgi:hypothetical protein